MNMTGNAFRSAGLWQRFRALIAALVLGAGALVAHADDTSPLHVVLKFAHVTLDDQGHEHLLDADGVKPGDVLEYSATYTNTSKKAIRALVATLPVPSELEYLAHSAKASAGLPAAEAATEDGRFGSEPLMRMSAVGKKESVPYRAYRRLHWKVGSLSSGASVTVSARMRLVADNEPSLARQ